MPKRTIKKIIPALREDIEGLITYRALPLPDLDYIDPFLLLNHHGPQNFEENNSGLPFGPHPHRGFETVTFILDGDVSHKDSKGHIATINSGGVQWMTAGSGIIHSEESSKEFKKKGGKLEILQLWVNLPSHLKMTRPKYTGLQKEDISSHNFDNGRVRVQMISGEWSGRVGPFDTLIDVTTMLIHLKEGAQTKLAIGAERNIFFYLIRGKVNVNGQMTNERSTVLFENDSDLIELSSEEDSIILFCHAPPLKEPFVSAGPFVMNTREEILEAIRDYQSGKFE
jgi:redox-sensitive bicupin YhaK (pirin superfamily)